MAPRARPASVASAATPQDPGRPPSARPRARGASGREAVSEADSAQAPLPAFASKLRPALLAWFDREKRDLPWRRTRDPYAIWLSEVMLQQTQVATVIPYFQRFLGAFPTVEALAYAPEDAVLAAWKGLGYYSRARNLHRCAKEVAAQGGRFPRTAEALLELPGFGRYTAGAVASIAFGAEAPLVDGNVARVLSRLFLVEGPTGDRAREKRLWALATALVRGERPGDWNQALMELGAKVCRPENPTCLLCPVAKDCGARKTGRVAELPPPRVRAPRKSLRLALALWEREGAWLMGRRDSKGLFGGLWELPAVEWDGEGELSSRFTAALGTQVRVGAEPLGEVKRTLTHRDLTLALFRVEGARRATPKALPPYQELRFVSPGERGELGVSTAMQHALTLASGSNVSSKTTPRRGTSGHRTNG